MIKPPNFEVGVIGAFHNCPFHLGVCVPAGMDRDVVAIRVNRTEVWRSHVGPWKFPTLPFWMENTEYPAPCTDHPGRTHFMMLNYDDKERHIVDYEDE